MRFWVDDRLVPAERASVAVTDHGFTVGDGVFETLRTVATASSEVVPFAADRHAARLVRSAVGLGLPEPDVEVVKVAMLAVCAANQEQLRGGGRLRVTYTAGPGPLGSGRASDAAPTLVVVAGVAEPWPPFETLALSPWPRNERSPLVGLKTTSYAENVMMLARARALGAGDALLRNLAGDLCEGTGTNFFLVRGDEVLTPGLDSGALAGITRELVLLWGPQSGIPVRETELGMAELTSADAAFVTSSTRDVHRVATVLAESGQPLVAFDPNATGDVVSALANVFSARSQAEPNP